MTHSPRLPRGGNGTWPELIRRILEVAASSPRRIALEHEGRTVDYATLVERAMNLAVELKTRGLGLGQVVAVALERSPNHTWNAALTIQCAISESCWPVGAY